MKNKKFKNILITGIAGSGGSYLAEYISKNHPYINIHGVSRWHSTSDNDNLDNISSKINVHEIDLLDFGGTLTLLSKIKPDVIFNLASNANVKSSFTNTQSIVNNNIMSTLNLLESVKYLKINPIIQMCSTSEVYGQVQLKDTPVKENCFFKPASPYAVSKVTQDLLGQTYHMNYGFNIITTRMFSYLNPRRKDLFASSFARQIALIEKGKLKFLKHGNLNSIRTLIDVRDAVSAYWKAVTKGKIGEIYNIGGKKTLKVGEFLEILKSYSKVNIVTKLDKNLLRPTDVTLQIPDISKFVKQTHWSPKYSFEESLEYILDYWRERV